MKKEQKQMLNLLLEQHISIFKLKEEDETFDYETGELMTGYFAYCCFPGCLPESEPIYLGKRKDTAIEQAYEYFIGD